MVTSSKISTKRKKLWRPPSLLVQQLKPSHSPLAAPPPLGSVNQETQGTSQGTCAPSVSTTNRLVPLMAPELVHALTPPAVRQLNLASLNRYGSLGVTYAAQWERPGVRIRDIHWMYRVEYEDARGSIMLHALELSFLSVSHVLLLSSLLPIYTPNSPWFGT